MRIMVVAPPWLPVPPSSYGGTEAVVDRARVRVGRSRRAAVHDRRQHFPFAAQAADYCLFLGRMNSTKGPHRAARVARDAGAPLVIAAKMREPDEHHYFEEHVRPLLDDRIVYVGEVGGATSSSSSRMLTRS